MEPLPGTVALVEGNDIIDFGPNTQRVKLTRVTRVVPQTGIRLQVDFRGEPLDLNWSEGYVLLVGRRDTEANPGNEMFVSIMPPDIPIRWHRMPRTQTIKCVLCKNVSFAVMDLVQGSNARGICTKCFNKTGTGD